MSGEFSAAARARLRAGAPLKIAGTVGFIAVFFLAYFETLNHPRFPVTVMAPGPVDGWIPYQGWTVGIYFTLWFYVSLPPALLAGRAALFRYGLVAAALAAAGLGIFALWPTKVVREGGGFLKQVDPGGNACPSMHAAYAVLSAVVLHRILMHLRAPWGWRAANILWCAAILYSTLATKQHVFADLVAGSALGLVAAQFLSSSRLNEPG